MTIEELIEHHRKKYNYYKDDLEKLENVEIWFEDNYHVMTLYNSKLEIAKHGMEFHNNAIELLKKVIK